MERLQGQRILAILASFLPLLLISCVVSRGPGMRGEYPKDRVQDSLIYAEMIDGLKEMSRDEGGRKTELTLESPLTARISASLDEKGVLSIDGLIRNSKQFSWYYPDHPYYLDASFVLFNSEMEVISRMPNYEGFGYINLTDDMFVNVPPSVEFYVHQKFDLNSVDRLSGRNRFCARFANMQIPQGLLGYMHNKNNGSDQPMLSMTSIMLMSNTVCFDLVRDGDELRLENISG